MSRIIGIDLGTTNSLAAVWQDGESKLIPNVFGEYLTPSVVSIGEDGTVYVGKTAKERLASYPDRTASVFKRFMGTARKYQLGDKSYSPEELSAFVLKKLKEDAENYLGEAIEEAVISVPAYFNDMARKATKRAGMIAGLKVERIINEPSAAALACQNLNQQEDALLLVFDFGGGTLDVSLVECFDNIIEIKAVSGDNQLGGQDFDDMIAGHFAKSLNLDYAAMKPETKAIIRKSAELCKRELTEKSAANMVVNCQEINNEIKITRKDVVKLCADLFERIGKPVSKVFVDAQTHIDQISQVVLVGGSCKMPVVQQYLSYLLKREDIVTKEPDYMIALGCGVCAGIKERDKDVKDLLLTDICPFSLGVKIANHQNPYKDLMSFIIERNSPLPSSREEVYANAHDRQMRIALQVYQGEAMYAEENLYLGEIMFDIPPMAAGQVQCVVRFTYDINGVLEVEAKIPLTKEEKKLVIVNKDLDMTQEEIDEKLKEFEKVKRPFADERNTYILEWGQRLFMQCSQDEMRNEILKRLQYFQHTISFDEYHLPKARKYLTVYFAYIEGLLNSYVGFADDVLRDGAWYQEEDEEEQEMETRFREWEEEKEDSGDNDGKG